MISLILGVALLLYDWLYILQLFLVKWSVSRSLSEVHVQLYI